MSNTGDAPDDTIRERAGGSRVKLWILMGADRRLVTGVLLAVVFGALVVAGMLYPPAEGAIRSGDSVDTLFQALVTATITGVTLVLTLNQLVLSQELGAVGDQRERMDEAMQFRQDVAEAVGTPVSPSRPAQFLRALVEVAGDRAETLREAPGGDLETAIDDLTASLITNADAVAERLDGARFGTFDVIATALDFNYSWKIFAARRIDARFGEDLGERRAAALEELLAVLELFGPAREHFKTLYFQWELIDLSRRILVAAVPALLVSAGMIVFFDSASYGVSILGLDTLVPVVALAATLSLVPFLLLLGYVLRIATVAKHTLSIGPFILRETGDVAEVQWDQ